MERQLNIIDYEVSKRIASKDLPFYALIAAAMRKADSYNMTKLRQAFPQVDLDLRERYNTGGGILPEDKITTDDQLDRVSQIADQYMRI